MKYSCVIFLFISISMSGQFQTQSDSLDLFNSIYTKIEELNSTGVKETIVMKDNGGNTILIWKRSGRFYALSANYRESNSVLTKQRITNRNKERLNYLMHNMDQIVVESNLKDCFIDAYNITRVWLNFNNQGFNFSFDTNCKQNNLVKPLYDLYLNLFR